jgi:hypothetical protein
MAKEKAVAGTRRATKGIRKARQKEEDEEPARERTGQGRREIQIPGKETQEEAPKK